MDEIDNDLLFSSLIKINYDKRFIRIAQDFIENLSLLAGASRNESLQMSLLIEESLSFIIHKYIDCRVAAYIQICFQVTADRKLAVEITDIGPPIHESMIPSFDIANEDSEEGLWYKVVRELSDKFAFMNKLGSGWLIQIEKNIENVTFNTSEDDVRRNGDPAERADRSGEKHIRPATVGDVPALIDLAYMTYRYSYDIDFYNEDLLKKYIDEKRYNIMLVEHGSKVIGAYAIKYLDTDHLAAEVGGAMILPEYRSGDTISLMQREYDTYVRTNPDHCEFFVSTAVTSHHRSQKAISQMGNGFKPLMLCLNMIARPVQFIGIDYQSGAGESLIFVYHLNHKLKTRKLYITAVNHLPIINELIAYTGNNLEVLTEFSEPENPESQISVQRIDSLKFAAVSIESIGQDWYTVLSKRIFTAIASGIESVKVTIPTSSPLPSDMERMLTDLNLIFCGLSVRSLENIDLAYCLTTKPVDFSLMKLHDPIARKLLMHVEQNYHRNQLNEQG